MTDESMSGDLIEKAEDLQVRLFAGYNPEDAGTIRMLIARVRELEAKNRSIALDALAAHGQAAEAYEAQLKAEKSAGGESRRFDLTSHLTRQREWGQRTFGPGPRTKGVANHIRKELTEIESDPADKREWVDVIILGFDGAMRAGYKPDGLVEAIEWTQTRNEGRVWPDWRTMSVDDPIEHDRTGEQKPKEEPDAAE